MPVIAYYCEFQPWIHPQRFRVEAWNMKEKKQAAETQKDSKPTKLLVRFPLCCFQNCEQPVMLGTHHFHQPMSPGPGPFSLHYPIALVLDLPLIILQRKCHGLCHHTFITTVSSPVLDLLLVIVNEAPMAPDLDVGIVNCHDFSARHTLPQ